jgi:hypothetical protein
MSNYTFNNIVSTSPTNCNVGYNNSWLKVENNAGREIFSQASYITNLSDINISLSASNLSIGNVHIADHNTGLNADVVNVGIGSGALRVITQDLESTQDDVTIGDRNGNFADIYPSLSALKVYVTNPIVNVPYSYTLCETKTTGNPSFTPKQILIHNSANSDVNVDLTLTSGLSCSIPIGKSSTGNHIVSVNLAVSQVNNYNGCSINFFA